MWRRSSKKLFILIVNLLAHYMVRMLNYLRTLLIVLDKMSIKASLAVIDMPLIELDLTLHMLHNYCAGLLIDQVISIDKLLSESCDIPKGP